MIYLASKYFNSIIWIGDMALLLVGLGYNIINIIYIIYYIRVRLGLIYLISNFNSIMWIGDMALVWLLDNVEKPHEHR